MADPKLRFKRSSVPGKIPNETNVPLGEIAINTYDGKVFASKNVGIGTTVYVVNPWNVGVGTDAYDINFTVGNVGIGSTLPSSKLSIIGDANVTGVVTASSFYGLGTNLTGIVTSIIAGTNVNVSSSTGEVTINLPDPDATNNYLITLIPSFDSVGTAFTMQYGGNSYSPINEQQLIVSLAGVIQEPGIAYTVSGSTLYFSSAPATSSDYFIVAINSGIATVSNYSTVSGVSTSVIGGVGSISSLDVSGITTTGILNVGTGGTIITTTGIGSVGIGTVTPQYELDVVGNLNITENFYVRGNLITLTSLDYGLVTGAVDSSTDYGSLS